MSNKTDKPDLFEELNKANLMLNKISNSQTLYRFFFLNKSKGISSLLQFLFFTFYEKNPYQSPPPLSSVYIKIHSSNMHLSLLQENCRCVKIVDRIYKGDDMVFDIIWGFVLTNHDFLNMKTMKLPERRILCSFFFCIDSQGINQRQRIL